MLRPALRFNGSFLCCLSCNLNKEKKQPVGKPATYMKQLKKRTKYISVENDGTEKSGEQILAEQSMNTKRAACVSMKLYARIHVRTKD